MKKLTVLSAIALVVMIVHISHGKEPVYFADANLKAAVEQALGISDPNATEMLCLGYLPARERGIVNLTGLEYATNLSSLNLEHNQITNIQPLSGLTNLDNLYLDYNQITNIEPLSGLTNLENLNLAHNQITNIEPLSGLTNLQDLWLKYNQITNIEPLSGLTNLENLNLEQNQITNIEALSGLTNLQWLDLYYNQITNIEPLSGLTNLEDLDLDYNQITDIEALSGLTNLQWLDLAHNQITNIEPLSGLTGLQVLWLDHNQITNIEPLSGLTSLQDLDLDHNQITDIQPLSGLTNLQVLDLDHNQITNIEPLSGLTNLQVLDLVRNQITNIEPLSGLTNLQWLDLYYNQITNIQPLSGLTNLSYLDLCRNPLNSEACDVYIPLIKANNPGITLRYDSCITPPVASFTISLEDPNNPGFRNKIRLDANDSHDPNGQIVSYQWDFGDGNTAQGMVVTHAYADAGDYQITLTVTDNDGLVDTETGLYHLSVPVILVHGWRGDPTNWADLINALNTHGIGYWVFSYPENNPPYAIGNPTAYAMLLRYRIDELRVRSGYYGKFDIVCHSMGAMVSRWYMEKLSGDDNVRQWLGLAPVNNGAAIASFGYLVPNFLGWLFPGLIGTEEAITHMEIRSLTLARLNYDIPEFNIERWGSNQSLSSKVIYRNLMGINDLNDRTLAPGTAGKTYVYKKDVNGRLYHYWTWQGDGVVAMAQSMLTGSNVGNEIFIGRTHSGTPTKPYTAICRDPIVINKVVSYLMNPGLELVNNYPLVDPCDDHSATGKGNRGYVYQNQTAEIKIPVDSTVDKAVVELGWPGSELSLTLISPRGKVLEPNAAAEYYKSDTSVWYTINNPEIGEWTAVVEAVNVPAEGESFDLVTFYSSLLTLTGTTGENRTLYYVGEMVNLKGCLDNNEVPVPGASVAVKIMRPDLSIDSLDLYDDGTHGDVNAGDGCYSTQYLLANKGAYQIVFSAHGTFEDVPFERTEPMTLWVTYLGDIDWDEDVNFSDFALFAYNWLEMDCEESNSWCAGTDLDKSGRVDIFDLVVLADHWLEGL